jgi:hypothetical protein
MIWLIFGVIGILVWGVLSLLDCSEVDREVYEFEKRKALAQVAYWEYYRTVVLPLMKDDINKQWELTAKVMEEGRL